MGHGKKVGGQSMGHRWACDGPSMTHGWAALGSQLGDCNITMLHTLFETTATVYLMSVRKHASYIPIEHGKIRDPVGKTIVKLRCNLKNSGSVSRFFDMLWFFDMEKTPKMTRRIQLVESNASKCLG